MDLHDNTPGKFEHISPLDPAAEFGTNRHSILSHYPMGIELHSPSLESIERVLRYFSLPVVDLACGQMHADLMAHRAPDGEKLLYAYGAEDLLQITYRREFQIGSGALRETGCAFSIEKSEVLRDIPTVHLLWDYERKGVGLRVDLMQLSIDEAWICASELCMELGNADLYTSLRDRPCSDLELQQFDINGTLSLTTRSSIRFHEPPEYPEEPDSKKMRIVPHAVQYLQTSAAEELQLLGALPYENARCLARSGLIERLRDFAYAGSDIEPELLWPLRDQFAQLSRFVLVREVELGEIDGEESGPDTEGSEEERGESVSDHDEATEDDRSDAGGLADRASEEIVEISPVSSTVFIHESGSKDRPCVVSLRSRPQISGTEVDPLGDEMDLNSAAFSIRFLNRQSLIPENERRERWSHIQNMSKSIDLPLKVQRIHRELVRHYNAEDAVEDADYCSGRVVVSVDFEE